MSPVIRIVTLVWPIAIAAIVVVARLRDPNLPTSDFLTVVLTALIPLAAVVVFLYLKRGGFGRPSAPQPLGVALLVALLTLPAVGVGSFLILMFAFGL